MLHSHEPLHVVADIGVVFCIWLDPLSCVSKDNLAVRDQGLRKQCALEMKTKKLQDL